MRGTSKNQDLTSTLPGQLTCLPRNQNDHKVDAHLAIVIVRVKQVIAIKGNLLQTYEIIRKRSHTQDLAKSSCQKLYGHPMSISEQAQLIKTLHGSICKGNCTNCVVRRGQVIRELEQPKIGYPIEFR